MRNRHLIAVLVAALSLVLAGCGTEVTTGIVGDWKGETVKQDFHFHSDGKVDLKDPGGSTYAGTYTVTDSNTLTCTFQSPVFSAPVVMEAEISGDTLTLTADSGREEVYVRE